MPPRSEPVSSRDRPAKEPLSRRLILDAARALIRERGLDAVSLRQVAEAVQTGPASLYAYFDNRDSLLEHVLDAIYSQVELVDASDGDWKGALAATITNTILALESYPGIGSVALAAIPTLPGALRLAEHELGLMEAGGIDPARAALAVDLIAQFVAATAIEGSTIGTRSEYADRRRRAGAVYETADPVAFPHLARSARELTGPDKAARVEFSIDVILSGLEASSPR